ncbi:rab-GTPase-TBC domain-containing protein [Xylaria cf. heliscus]|nr:rab-GTPase-TBC domain-containing protein [Xylaria cf. heliscus]
MATLEQPTSEATPTTPRPDSPAASDRDTDTFEDAVDTGSVRSLTNRKPPQPSSPPPVPISTDVDSVHDAPESPVSIEKPNGHAIDEPIEDTDDAKDSVTIDSARASKRFSDASQTSLDNVDLDDDPPSEQPKVEAVEVEEQAVPEIAKKPTKKLSLSNIASSLPSMPWSPSNGESPQKTSPVPPASNTTLPHPPPPPTRKITSPFSWLSRNSGSKENATPPASTNTGSPRRNTASSIATLTSNPEMMLSKLEEEDSSTGANGGVRLSRNSLRDRFKLVRLREEAGISLNPSDDEQSPVVANLITRSATMGIMSTGTETVDSANAQIPPASPLPPTADTSLAPGTVSGVSAGPSAMSDTPVDWDLWQAVVYEGPAAVARTSAEELNLAIATGIPNAIRGVVWQVLAQSKNEDLELVYKELLSRGTEKDKDRNSNSTAASILSNSNLIAEKEPAASSASSTKSEQSGSGKRLPGTPPELSDAALKAQALAAIEKKKKEKEDAAAIQRLEKTIRRDLGTRTSYSKYAAAAGLQEGLFGVCKAYALFDEGVGYAQGMNFLIMPLLFNMPEEEAFCLLVRLMNQYKLRDLFIQDMPGLHMHLYQFERILEDLEPALYCHLHRRGISPHLYATQWFLTLFAYRFPLQLVLRIYDLILSDGLSAILRFGIVLMQKNTSALLGMSDMSQLTTFLKDKLFDVYIDQSPSAGSILENGFFGSSSSNLDKEVYRADQLIRDACEVKLTPEILKAYATEWEEKTRSEKEREQELEQLRAANVNLAIKVRKLEERIEVSDREQADMANDLIHTKVENEELKDKNESLTGQVRELRIVIEKQPEEIEQAWKPERDDLMKRNAKVHEENERLEKELSELEEQLVQTKMQYAETNSQHEALKRKWQELKKQFA